MYHGEALTLTTNNRIFDLSKLKAFTDNRIDVGEKLKFGFWRVENIVGRGENAGHLFPHCFLKGLSLKVVKSRDCAVRS